MPLRARFLGDIWGTQYLDDGYSVVNCYLGALMSFTPWNVPWCFFVFLVIAVGFKLRTLLVFCRCSTIKPYVTGS